VNALAPALLALAWLAHFASGDRVVSQLAAAQADRPALHVEAALSAADPSAPKRVQIDLHPELGMRVADDRGRRWLLRSGRMVAGTVIPAPPWLPDLEILALRHEGGLRTWLGVVGVDASANELARCGASECYVLGTRQSMAQLWVDKRTLEVRRIILPGRGPADLEEWQPFEKLRFPARIEIASGASTSTLAIQSVVVAPAWVPADFSEMWVEAAPASEGR
jgi:hypothetical protein